MSPKELLTTTEAARIASVGASTIKRWADQGALPFVRTVGGHRRFERSSVERMLREHGAGQRRGVVAAIDAPSGAPFRPLSSDHGPSADPLALALAWRAVLERAQRYELDGRLLEARARLGRWCDVADEVAAGLRELGLAWSRGELSIAQEHVASESLSRALARVGDALPTRLEGPRVLLACAGADEHTLGLSLAELCTRELGATPVWLGRRTPEAELIRALSDQPVRALVLSASAVCADEGALAGLVREVGAVCQQRDVALVLGGSGAWPQAPRVGTRVRSFRDFHLVLQRELSRPQRGAG